MTILADQTRPGRNWVPRNGDPMTDWGWLAAVSAKVLYRCQCIARASICPDERYVNVGSGSLGARSRWRNQSAWHDGKVRAAPWPLDAAGRMDEFRVAPRPSLASDSHPAKPVRLRPTRTGRLPVRVFHGVIPRSPAGVGACPRERLTTGPSANQRRILMSNVTAPPCESARPRLRPEAARKRTAT